MPFELWHFSRLSGVSLVRTRFVVFLTFLFFELVDASEFTFVQRNLHMLQLQTSQRTKGGRGEGIESTDDIHHEDNFTTQCLKLKTRFCLSRLKHGSPVCLIEVEILFMKRSHTILFSRGVGKVRFQSGEQDAAVSDVK